MLDLSKENYKIKKKENNNIDSFLEKWDREII